MSPFWVFILFTFITKSSTKSTSDDYEDGTDGEIAPSSYVLPEEIFNDGKAFYVEKDPVSGKLDFNIKKSSDIVDIPNDVDAQKDKDISLNTNSIPVPNFHDFLNLPVKYSSSKFVYPLVSSSYANLKYQGNNKNYISNHKNYSTTTTTTTSPKYYTSTKTSVPSSTIVITERPTISTTLTTRTTTTEAPTQETSPTTSKPIFTRPPPKYTTTKYKYSTIRKRPVATNATVENTNLNLEMPPSTPVPSTTNAPLPSSTILDTTTRQTSKYTMASIPTTTVSYSTMTSTSKNILTTSSMPFKPLPASETTLPTRIPHPEMHNKKDPDTMTLSELFNSLLEEDQNSSKEGPSSEITFELETKKPGSENNTLEITTDRNNDNEYVSFNVQQPNINRLQYQPMPNMNNVLISPDQHSATFVLGSQQAVRGNGQYIGSAEKVKNNEKPTPQNPYQIGSIYNDVSLSSMKPQGFTAPNQKPTVPSLPPLRAEGQDQFNTINTNVRFPTEDSFENAPIVTGTFNNDIAPPNGHGGPVALPQTGNGLVVFPPNTQSIEATVNAQHQAINNDYLDTTNTVSFNVGSNINFNGDSGNGNTGPNLNELGAQNQQNQFAQISGNLFQQQPNRESTLQPNTEPNYQPLVPSLTPPTDSPIRRPPFMDHHRQGPIRPSSFAQNDFTKKTYLNQNRQQQQQQQPVNDRTLPNILPQFRPNAKLSQGHTYPKETGNNGRPGQHTFGQRQPTLQQKIQHAATMTRHPPPYFRRNPPPNNFNAKMSPAAGPHPAGPMHPEMENNRRYFNIRPPMNDRMYGPPPPHPPPLPNRRYFDAYSLNKKNADLLDYQTDSYLPVSPKSEQDPRREAELEQDIIEQRGKLEPVVTLQMLQQKKLFKNDLPRPNLQQNQFRNSETPIAVASASDKPPVYVVYPVKTSPVKLDILTPKDVDDPVVVGHRGEQDPLPPPADASSVSTGNDYQNTPFTVIRQEQQPILMVKHKPQSHKASFPYTMEKPMPGFKGPHYGNKAHVGFYDASATYNTGEEPVDAMGRVINRGPSKPEEVDDGRISTKLTRLTERPIAIAYTPTEPNHYYGIPKQDNDKYSNANHASSVIQEILGDDGDTDEFGNPSHGENYEQDFQAPFYPSMNLGGNAPTEKRNGWAVVTPSSLVGNIDRSDSADESEEKITPPAQSLSAEEGASDQNTEHFSMDKFQPDFQGGFKPIYPIESKSQNIAPKTAKLPKDDERIEALVYEDDSKEESSTSS